MNFVNVVPANPLIALLAEDDQNDVVLIRRAVERLALIERLIVVPSGDEAVAYLEGDMRFADRQRFPIPHVLVLDQFMPRWSGLDVLLWLRSCARLEHIPVVMLSLGLSPAQTESARLLRAAYCPKTPHLEALPAAVAQAMRLTAAAKPDDPAWRPSGASFPAPDIETLEPQRPYGVLRR